MVSGLRGVVGENLAFLCDFAGFLQKFDGVLQVDACFCKFFTRICNGFTGVVLFPATFVPEA
jgi:hypothetical protein